MPAQLTSDSLPPTSHHGLSAAPREGRDEAALQGNCARCRNTAQGRRVWALAPGSLETTSLSQLHAHTDMDTCTSTCNTRIQSCTRRHLCVQTGASEYRYTYTRTCTHRHMRTDTRMHGKRQASTRTFSIHADVDTHTRVHRWACRHTQRMQTAGVTGPPSPLSADILQYYLACSPHAANPFQQVRAQPCLCRASGALAPTPRRPPTARPPTSSGPLGSPLWWGQAFQGGLLNASKSLGTLHLLGCPLRQSRMPPGQSRSLGVSHGRGVLCPPCGVTVWADVDLKGNHIAHCPSPHVPVWPSGSSGLRIYFKDAVLSLVCIVSVCSSWGLRKGVPQSRLLGTAVPPQELGAPRAGRPWAAGAAGTGASLPRGGLGTSGRKTGRPTRTGLSSLSVEQKLSGSHKALVEMQDVVAELLKTVSWEHPATKVRGWGPALEPASSLPSP